MENFLEILEKYNSKLNFPVKSEKKNQMHKTKLDADAYHIGRPNLGCEKIYKLNAKVSVQILRYEIMPIEYMISLLFQRVWASIDSISVWLLIFLSFYFQFCNFHT